MNQSKKQSGFALPLVILIVVVLIIAGGAGYYLYKTLQEQKEAEWVGPEQVIDETADWKTYRNEQLGFEFEYPNTWLLREETQVLKVTRLEPARSKFKISISFLGMKRDYPENPEIEKENAEKAFNVEYNEIKNCTKKRKINDIEFCVEEFACFEGGRITKYSAINQGNSLINIITFFHESGNFLKCLSDEDVSSELKDFNQILSTFKFIEKEDKTVQISVFVDMESFDLENKTFEGWIRTEERKKVKVITDDSTEFYRTSEPTWEKEYFTFSELYSNTSPTWPLTVKGIFEKEDVIKANEVFIIAQ